jgi:transcriptional regulator of arginine metabolism
MTISAETRSRRHGTIRTMLRRRKLRSQAELGAALTDAGHGVNQSTLCRDLRDLGVAKVDGIYRLPSHPDVAPAVADDPAAPGRLALARFVTSAVPAGPNLLVLRCAVGTGSAVGLAIDSERWSEVIGTVAGDDTLFVATATRRDQSAVLSQLRSIVGDGFGEEG